MVVMLTGLAIIMLIAGIILLPILIVQYAKTKVKTQASNGFGQTNNNPFQSSNGFGQANNNPFQSPNGYGMNTSFQADDRTVRKLNTLRALLIFDIIFVSVMTAVVIFGVRKYKNNNGSPLGDTYSKNETISSDPLLKDYIKTDYNIDGDNVVFDENNVKLTITGFYADPSNNANNSGADSAGSYDTILYESYSAGNVAIEYQIQNNSDYDISFVVECIGINGIAGENYGYSYETVKANSTITYYEESSQVRGGVIKDLELNINSIYVPYNSDADRVRFSSQGVRSFTTTANFSYEQLEPPKGSEPMYDDHGVRIYQAKLSTFSYSDSDYADDKKLCLIIYNDTDDTAEISCDQYKIDGVQSNDSSIHIYHDEKIPSNYVMISDDLDSVYLEAGTKDWKEIELSISFKFDEHPEYDFSTGYIKARQ